MYFHKYKSLKRLSVAIEADLSEWNLINLNLYLKSWTKELNLQIGPVVLQLGYSPKSTWEPDPYTYGESIDINGVLSKTVNEPFTEVEAHEYLDQFIEWVEERDLSFGGGFGITPEHKPWKPSYQTDDSEEEDSA